MSESRRDYYISEVTDTTVVLSPFTGTGLRETKPAVPALGQITIRGTDGRYAPCELWTPIQSCGIYEVIVRRKS